MRFATKVAQQGLITSNLFVTLTLTDPLFPMKYPCSLPAQFCLAPSARVDTVELDSEDHLP